MATGERHLRVLVVDDEPTIARVLVRVLHPHEVILASDAAQALAVLDGARFDAVLCDLGLPGLSGIQLREALPARSPLRDRWAFLTGGVIGVDDRDYIARERVTVVIKPFRATEVRELVVRLGECEALTSSGGT